MAGTSTIRFKGTKEQKCSTCGKRRKLLGQRNTNEGTTEMSSISGYWVMEKKSYLECTKHQWRDE